jgi:hypothetical protein
MSTTLEVPVTKPRFSPRIYTNEPDAFGRARNIAWKPVVPGTDDQHAAAQIQHLWAVEIRAAAIAKFKSVRGYANAAGINYHRISRILRGTEIMRLEDIAQAQRILDVGRGPWTDPQDSE